MLHALLHRLVPTVFSPCRGLPRSIPGPEPSWGLSTAGGILRWGNDPLGHARRLFREYGDVVALVRGGGTRTISHAPDCPGTVIARGAELTRTVTSLHDAFGKSNLSGPLFPGVTEDVRRRPLGTFGAGLFSVNGDEHRRHRRLLMPAFSKKRLQAYCEQMVQLTDAELWRWKVGELRETSSDMRRLTLNIVSRTMFGELDGSGGEAASAELQQALRVMGMPLTRVLPLDLPGLPFRRLLEATGRIEEQVREIVARKRRVERSPDASTGDGSAQDMLGTLLEAFDEESSSRLTEDELLGHVSVIFTAGHETSSNALNWTLFLLAQFPEVTAHLTEELASVLRGAPPTAEDLTRLPYLDAVVKESLRVFPPAPWNGRVMLCGAALGEHELPCGTEVLLSIYETHRDADVYHDPQAFRPERWETLRPSVYEYNPFSTGPRTCIGAAFALMEIKVVLSMVLTRFRLALVPQPIDRFAELVLTPKHGLTMQVCGADGNHRGSRARVTGNVLEMVDLP